MKKPGMGVSLLTLAAAAVLPLSAQTGTPTHHPTSTTATHHAAGGCVTAPQLSPKIPALAATASCVKALYTLTRVPTLKLDYASPMVSRTVREELGEGPETFSLQYADTKEGTGPLVQEHACLTVQYTGYLENGTKFDSSHDHPGGEPFTFLYGAHHVIPGWDTGFEGMHMGGQRRLFIPWELAYGEGGKGPIPPKAELIFDVEAVSQSAPRPGAPPGGECMQAEPRPHMPGANPTPGENPHPGTNSPHPQR